MCWMPKSVNLHLTCSKNVFPKFCECVMQKDMYCITKIYTVMLSVQYWTICFVMLSAGLKIPQPTIQSRKSIPKHSQFHCQLQFLKWTKPGITVMKTWLISHLLLGDTSSNARCFKRWDVLLDQLHNGKPHLCLRQSVDVISLQAWEQ